jgi:MFS family permease
MSKQETEYPDPPKATPAQRKSMRLAIVAQCLGCLGSLAFANNLIFLYLSAHDISRERIVLYLALPMLSDVFVRIPAAYLSDRFGKKRFGLLGLVMTVAGFLGIIGAGWCPPSLGEALLVAGILVMCSGNAIFSASWFALLSPIVPQTLRGRFFGKLRFSWQTVGIAFGTLCALALHEQSSIGTFQALLAVGAVGLAVRAFVYTRIPELERHEPRGKPLAAAIGTVIRAEGYMSFCSYAFLLSLFTASCPILFGLIEKQIALLGDGQVAWMGNLMMIGAVFGFLAGGKAVDRFGTKPVFLACHFGYGAVLLLFLARGAAPWSILYTLGSLRFLFGLVGAASSIAISTELLALIPPEDKSLSTSVCMTLARAGGALSGVLSAWVLKLGILQESWVLGGLNLSSYDTLLLACGVMVLILTVTLGLVPSVIRKSEWMPGGDRRD